MGLHALESMDEYPSTFHIHGSLLGHEVSFYLTSRPEDVLHGAPWFLWVCAVIAGPIFTYNEARCYTLELDVDDGIWRCGGFDVITVAVIGEIHEGFVTLEAGLVVGEVVLLHLFRGPKRWSSISVEDLGGELSGCSDAAVQSSQLCSALPTCGR